MMDLQTAQAQLAEAARQRQALEQQRAERLAQDRREIEAIQAQRQTEIDAQRAVFDATHAALSAENGALVEANRRAIDNTQPKLKTALDAVFAALAGVLDEIQQTYSAQHDHVKQMLANAENAGLFEIQLTRAANPDETRGTRLENMELRAAVHGRMLNEPVGIPPGAAVALWVNQATDETERRKRRGIAYLLFDREINPPAEYQPPQVFQYGDFYQREG